MKASGSKLPGTTAFNIESVVDEQGSDEHVEVLDSLPLGAMAFGDLEPDQIDLLMRQRTIYPQENTHKPTHRHATA